MTKDQIVEFWKAEGFRVTSHYGPRIHPVTGKRSTHTGIDLVKAHQAPILSFADGMVQFATEARGSGFGGFGKTVAVRDKAGHLHCYCHLDSIVVNVGQSVKAGDMVGRQGSTGISTGSHLHYEVRPKPAPSNGWGSHVDPTEYLSEYLRKEVELEMAEFIDVKKGAWYEKAVDRVSDLGLMVGYPDKTFRPDQPVTRAELAAVIEKLLDMTK